MKYENVIGMKFGKLTIIEELPRIKNSKENQTFRVVKCKCDCGNVIDIKLVYLTRSHNPRRSCGCLHSESQKNRKSKRNDKFKNLEGLKFNKLTVIKFLGKNSDKYKNNNMWGCICDCGNIKQATTSALTHNKIKSCGCMQFIENHDRLTARNRANGSQEDLTGKKFGKLNVIGKEIVDNQTYWKVWCDCQNSLSPSKRETKLYKRYKLVDGLVKSCGCMVMEDFTNQKFNHLTVLNFGEVKDGKRLCDCLCDCGNHIVLPISRVVGGYTKTCGKCSIYGSLGEEKVRNILKQNNITFEEQYKYDDLYFKDSRYKLRFDFYVNNEYLIEYDGEQHFQAKEFWGGDIRLKESQYRDELKNEYCLKHGIPLIRIPYWHYNDLKLEDLLLETSEFLVI